MKTCTKCKIEKSLNEFHKDKTTKDGLGPHCKLCVKRYTDSRKEAKAEYDRLNRLNNSERLCEQKRRYKQSLSEEQKSRMRKLERGRRKINPPNYSLQTSMRRARKYQATPTWANKDKIRQIYEEAIFRSKEYGYKLHVDHIVPLKNDIVCGLHCEHNLRIVTPKENLVKSNKYWPDMP